MRPTNFADLDSQEYFDNIGKSEQTYHLFADRRADPPTGALTRNLGIARRLGGRLRHAKEAAARQK
jgi:hypothetical protein